MVDAACGWMLTSSCQAHVEDLLVEQGRAVGVRLKNGATIRAREAGRLEVRRAHWHVGLVRRTGRADGLC